MLALESAGRDEEALRAAETLLRFQHMIVEAALEADRFDDSRRLLEHALAAVAESERLLGEHERRFVLMRREDIARAAIARGVDEISEEFGHRSPQRSGATAGDARRRAPIRSLCRRCRQGGTARAGADPREPGS